MREYNTTGVCIPSKHYMVDISDKVAEIRKMIDSGYYFTINRGRQYGKTTTLFELYDALMTQYVVISMSFERISESGFKDEHSFVEEFCRLLRREFRREPRIPNNIREEIDTLFKQSDGKASLGDLFDVILEWCNETEAPVVLIIDEIDYATNFQVFLDFLAQLRAGYISRNIEGIPTFQSVIFAGVTDVSLLGRIHGEDQCWTYIPWNIATDFDIDMSLSEAGIKGMLDEYEADHQTGMDTGSIARMIREYTNGYPYLVSRICQLIDEMLVPNIFPTLSKAWTAAGVEKVVNLIVRESSCLLYSLMDDIKYYDEFREQLKYMLLGGKSIPYRPYDTVQERLKMYGFIVTDGQEVQIANRIFEMRILRYLIGESAYSSEMSSEAEDHKSEFIKGGQLDVPLIMAKFIDSQQIIRHFQDEGREKFLAYISSIINGVGTCNIEGQNINGDRMDVVIHYNGRRYVIELKIWHDERYSEDGERQIIDYLDRFDLHEGYMLSFIFDENKKPGVNQAHIGNKLLYEGIVYAQRHN